MKIEINYAPHSNMWRLFIDRRYVDSTVTYWGALWKKWKWERLAKRNIPFDI